MQPWQVQPLGFAIVDETRPGVLVVHHVSIDDEHVASTGLWELVKPQAERTRNLLTHRIPLGTLDGVRLTEKILGERLRSADLAGLVAACESAEVQLNETWEAYRDEEPKKRANLKPLQARNWPLISSDGDAARILENIGRKPFPSTTPKDMRDILALANLTRYIIETWYELESERISRAYLRGNSEARDLYPPAWLSSNPPYWPTQESLFA